MVLGSLSERLFIDWLGFPIQVKDNRMEGLSTEPIAIQFLSERVAVGELEARSSYTHLQLMN